MFKHTKALLWYTLEQVKEIAFIISAIVHSITVAYFTYALIAKTGNFIVNLLFLILSVFYLGYFIYKRKNKVSKITDKRITRFTGYAKRVLKLYQIVPMIVIILTSDTTNPITLLTVVLSALMLAVQILLDILIVIIEKRWELFREAFDADIDEFKKPFTATGDFFKKVVGKEVEKPEPTKKRTFLKSLVEKRKQLKAEKKSAKKEIAASKDDLDK